MQRVCLAELRTTNKVIVSTVLAKALQHLQVKGPAADRTLLSLTKFVVDLGAGHMVDELCEFHSQEVNPNELSVTHTLFEESVKQVGPTKCPILKMRLLTLAYNGTGAVAKVRPSPDVCDFVKLADVRSLCSKAGETDKIETWLRTMRIKHEPVLKSWLPGLKARKVLRELEQAGLRAVLGKAATLTFKEAAKTKATKGDFCSEKMLSIEQGWLRWVEVSEKPPATSTWTFLPAAAAEDAMY